MTARSLRHLDEPGTSFQQRMLDLLFIGTAVVFFVISVAYVNACEKLRGAPRD